MKRVAREDHCEFALPTLPPGASRWISPELVALTIRTWQPYYQETLTPEVAIAIIMNVGRLVEVLGSQTDETICRARSGQ